MAGCDISSGRVRPCKDGLGGNSTLYLYNELVDPFTVVDGEATAMSVALAEAWEFELEGDLNTFEQSMEAPRDTFSRVNTQTATFVFKVPDAATNAQFNFMVAGFVQGVLKDRNGNYWAIGSDDGFDFTVVHSTGGAKADGNLYTITGVATTGELAPILDSATETAFLAVVV